MVKRLRWISLLVCTLLLCPIGASSQTPEDPAPLLAGATTIASVPGQITLELKNVDIIEVLKLLSRKGNINMVTSPTVRGRVTLFLQNVEVWEALRTIFETNSLAYIQEGSILKVITSKEYEELYGRKFEDKRVLRVIPIQYADANDVANTIKQTRKIPGTITVDERTNALVVLEMPSQLEHIEQTVKQLDVPIAPKTFHLEYASPQGVEEAAKKLLSKKGSLYADAMTNQLIVTDFLDNVEKVGQLLQALDKRPNLQTKVFDLHYAKYDEIEAKIKSLISPDVGTIHADQRTNKVVVTDHPEKLRRITEIIVAYDEKSREVLIEAKIVEVTLTDDYRFGLNWESIFNNLIKSGRAFNLNVGSAFEQITQVASTSTVLFPRATSAPGIRLVGSGELGGSVGTFNAVLDALKGIGDTRVLSNPRLTALDGEEAIFKDITREAFVTDTVVQNQSAATTAENVTFVDVGVNLKITPEINPDHYITLKIKPEVSSVARTLTTATNNTIPIVSSQELETVVMVKDGTTLILGGLIKNKSIITVNRVPVLGNIPFIGNFFSKDIHDVDKKELVFFLTPTIVSGDFDFVASSRRLMETLAEREKLLWKSTDDADYADRLNEIKRDVYPADNPEYPTEGSAKVSPLRPSQK